MIVHENIYDELKNKLLSAYDQVKIGDPLDSETLMGPLVNDSAIIAYESAIEKIKESGGKILCGGSRLEKNGNFVHPTIAEVENDWDIVQEETFAPILYVMKYKTIKDALDMHNNVPQGLSSSIFTNQIKHAEYFLSNRGSDCGIANVNIGTSGAEIGGAFGGEKKLVEAESLGQTHGSNICEDKQIL